jgi:PhnB protein
VEERVTTMHSSPYVNFQGKAREAMEFYQSVLGGTLDLLTVSTQGEVRPAGPGERVMQARLEADGVLILGSDGHPTYPPTVGDNMALVVSGTDEERLAQILNGLAEGGRIKGRLSAVPWGGKTGYVEDRFGINWMVSVEPA